MQELNLNDIKLDIEKMVNEKNKLLFERDIIKRNIDQLSGTIRTFEKMFYRNCKAKKVSVRALVLDFLTQHGKPCNVEEIREGIKKYDINDKPNLISLNPCKRAGDIYIALARLITEGLVSKNMEVKPYTWEVNKK